MNPSAAVALGAWVAIVWFVGRELIRGSRETPDATTHLASRLDDTRPYELADRASATVIPFPPSSNGNDRGHAA